MKHGKIKEIKESFQELFSEKKELTTGELGEQIVCNYLEDRGFSIVSKNYRKKFGEIDIVARKTSKFHFVEVKTSTLKLSTSDVDSLRNNGHVSHETAFIDLENRVTQKKARRLRDAIQTFLFARKFWSTPNNHGVSYETANDTINKEPDWQFDIASVLIDRESKKALVKLIENMQI